MKDIWDILTDADNTDVITLKNESGRTTDFVQAAVIPHGTRQDTVYAVLQPLRRLAGISENSFIVYSVRRTVGSPSELTVVDDGRTLESVIAAYRRLLSAQGGGA